jgi:hypothetical protein
MCDSSTISIIDYLQMSEGQWGFFNIYTDKPVLRGHLWDKAKVVTGDLLKEVQFI